MFFFFLILTIVLVVVFVCVCVCGGGGGGENHSIIAYTHSVHQSKRERGFDNLSVTQVE